MIIESHTYAIITYIIKRRKYYFTLKNTLHFFINCCYLTIYLQNILPLPRLFLHLIQNFTISQFTGSTLRPLALCQLRHLQFKCLTLQIFVDIYFCSITSIGGYKSSQSKRSTLHNKTADNYTSISVVDGDNNIEQYFCVSNYICVLPFILCQRKCKNSSCVKLF